MKLFKFLFALPLMLTIYIAPASAQYSYELVIPSATAHASLWDINDAGKVVGGAWNNDGDSLGSFEYDMKKGLYTPISGEEEFNARGINNPGVMVGDVDGVCAIRDKHGIITTFFPPSYTTGSSCWARGVNANGKVSGYLSNGSDLLGFIYDSEYGTYEEVRPSTWTRAHKINAQGQNVGEVYLLGGDVYDDSPKGRYGYLREPDGSFRYFEISQSQSDPGWTFIRGISENGLICGVYKDPDTLEVKGFATTIPKGSGFETISLTNDEVLHLSPCNPDLPPPPDGYVLLTDVWAYQVRNDGVVVGGCADYHYNSATDEIIWYPTSGFIATPIR